MIFKQKLTLNKTAMSLGIACVLSTSVMAVPSLDGTGNNPHNPTLGAVNTQYSRISSAAYADGIGQMVDGPALRYISNRIFADSAQNLFAETGVTQWAYNWGQFIDHSIGLRVSGHEKICPSFSVMLVSTMDNRRMTSLRVNNI